MDRVLTRAELKAECDRLFFDPPLAQFDVEDVPESLREFVPYAEIWGHNAEDTRADIVQETPLPLREHVGRVVLRPEVQDRFEGWLAGPEVDRLKLTPGYLAFTCLLMSADEMG